MSTPARTRAAGLSMILGGVLLAVPPFLGPPDSSSSTRQRLQNLAENPTTPELKSLFFQAAVLLLLPGVAAIAGRTHGRGAGATVSGAVVYGAGIVGAFAFVVIDGLAVSLAEGRIDASVVAASDRMESGPVVVPTFVLALLFFHLLGLPWLTFGMVRAQQVPLWLAVAATVGTMCAFFGSGTLLESFGWVLTGAALALLGRTILLPEGQGLTTWVTRPALSNSTRIAPPVEQ